MSLTDADRYDLSTNTWDKIANFLEPRCKAYGAEQGSLSE